MYGYSSIYYFLACAGCISENLKHVELISRRRDMRNLGHANNFLWGRSPENHQEIHEQMR